MITDINNEDRLVQTTFADHLADHLGWDTAYAWNHETFGPNGTFGRTDTRDAVLPTHLRAALRALNPGLPQTALDDAYHLLVPADLTRSLIQHNRDLYRFIRGGVPVKYRDAAGNQRTEHVRVIDFRRPQNNRFLAVRELKLTGLRTPGYNRRADLVCFVNGLPLVFIELKAVYVDIRAAFDGNLRDYLGEHVVAHAFHHNAFLVVSNGVEALYGSITSEWDHFTRWKRLDEEDKGSVEAQILLDGMLAKDRLLDLVENFVLFDESKPGKTRKVVARNQQVLGVNRAVAAVARQEELKSGLPNGDRRHYRIVTERPLPVAEETLAYGPSTPRRALQIVERAHPELGKLGVFWHTQGSGKSYSMAFFAEKVRRTVKPGFTFVVMTDRRDLDDQIYKTFVGCGFADEGTPRAESGPDLQRILGTKPRYVFSLIHKFNTPPRAAYNESDDIIVISDEAHRTQSGKLARNMRRALPNAAFIGFTGTPILDHDEETRQIFGPYVSRYDFKRSEEDGATVKLVYDNRGEKLGVAHQDLNARIAETIEKAELTPEKEARLHKLLGKDYEVITADARLDRIADDFVEHAAERWQSGKAMLVCVDKLTCARMLKRILPRWEAKLAAVRAAAMAEADPEKQARLEEQARWMEQTIVEIIISEAQNEVEDFAKQEFDIVPHRARMKRGFEIADGKRIDVEAAFKDPEHPFRIAVVCAMWLTGFDVECLSTLYIDKPMKAHTLMQAIARANRRFPGKDFGLIVDYNGMLAALRAALARYALGEEGATAETLLAPLEDRVHALLDAIEHTEGHLRTLGFDPARLQGSTGFARLGALRDGENAVSASDDGRRRYEILAGEVLLRARSLITEPAIEPYAERHDNIEAILRKVRPKRSLGDIADLLAELRRIVSEAIETQPQGEQPVESRRFDLSQIDLARLRDEFAKKVTRKATAIQDIRAVVEEKLRRMLEQNPRRMDFHRRYTDIVAEYNHEKDRVSIEETFAKLVDLAKSLDTEQRRAVEEGLSEQELALFDRLQKPDLPRAERERIKAGSKRLMAELLRVISPIDRWTEKEETQAIVRTAILDHVHEILPTPPFSQEDREAAAQQAYLHVYQQSKSGLFPGRAA